MLYRFLIAALAFAVTTPALSNEHFEAGFERQTAADGTEIGIWYPASGTPTHQRLGLYAQDIVLGAKRPGGQHPLIVISHGTGGDFTGHLDTAVALARAGFVVAALTHQGDNWRDRSRATQVERRPVALTSLITYMLSVWPNREAIDESRIGAFGFSSGGFTVLVAAGGRPDLSRIADHCAKHPAFFDCTLVKGQGGATLEPWPETKDERIKAIVVAAPALGFTFDEARLARIRIPVQLWRADDDRVLPAPFYADAVRVALPQKPAFETMPGAGHFDFLAPCVDTTIAPQICQSAPGFDRRAFHERFNARIVQFFTKKLKGRRG